MYKEDLELNNLQCLDAIEPNETKSIETWCLSSERNMRQPQL